MGGGTVARALINWTQLCHTVQAEVQLSRQERESRLKQCNMLTSGVTVPPWHVRIAPVMLTVLTAARIVQCQTQCNMQICNNNMCNLQCGCCHRSTLNWVIGPICKYLDRIISPRMKTMPVKQCIALLAMVCAQSTVHSQCTSVYISLRVYYSVLQCYINDRVQFKQR